MYQYRQGAKPQRRLSEDPPAETLEPDAPPTPERYKAMSSSMRYEAMELAKLRIRQQADERRQLVDDAERRAELLELNAEAEERLIIARTKAAAAEADFYSHVARVDRLAMYYQMTYGTTPAQGAARLEAAADDMARFNADNPGWTPTKDTAP